MVQDYGYSQDDVETTVFSTQVYAQADSHNFGKINITSAVMGFASEKTIAETGSISLNLAPYREWRDLLAANDLINVYVKLNSSVEESPYNRGWVRLFFGYIDEVRGNEGVDQQGVFTVRFSVSCSDFQKAVERTEVYNHPYLPGDEVFGANLEGSYLMRMGAAEQGSPRFLVMNHIVSLLGFGKQWTLPPHYIEYPISRDISPMPGIQRFLAGRRSKNDVLAVVQELRELAEKWTYLWSPDLRARLKELMPDKYSSLAEVPSTPRELFDPAHQALLGAIPDIASRVAAAAHIGTVPFTSSTDLDLAIKLTAIREFDPPPEGAPVQLTIDPYGAKVSARGLYDLLCFDYMEYADGFLFSATIWEHQGSLLELLRRDSHDLLNEMIFDLRPTLDLYGGDTTDGLGVDLEGGLAMVPCVVLREKPFTYYPPRASHISGVDPLGERLIDVTSIQRPEEQPPKTVTETLATASTSDEEKSLGELEVAEEFEKKVRAPEDPLKSLPVPTLVDFGGAVWLQRDRVVDHGQSLGLNSEALFTDKSGGDIHTHGLFDRGPRTLESIHITSKDVIQASLGRGDQDTVTGYDFIPITEIGEDQRFYRRDLSPIFRHLLIRRHGLRMVMRTSEFSGPLTPGLMGAYPDEGIKVPSGAGDPVLIPMRRVASSYTQYMTLRCIMLTDHWYQHNLEYLNGSITLRPMPGLRVGYKLVWEDRNLALYVESVSHNWNYPDRMTTTVKVTRGQPYREPLRYILPDDRARPEEGDSFRLGASFPVADDSYENPKTRKRKDAPPGYPGRYSPSAIWQNLNTSLAPGTHDIAAQFSDGVNTAVGVAVLYDSDEDRNA